MYRIVIWVIMVLESGNNTILFADFIGYGSILLVLGVPFVMFAFTLTLIYLIFIVQIQI